MMLKKRSIFLLLLAALLIFAAACGKDGASKGGSGKLVIYTARDQSVVDQVVGMFNEKYPDVEVEVLTMGAQQILERVRGEKANPQADFWWGGTQSALMVAANEDLLASFKPSFDKAIDANYKDADGRWY